MARGKTFWTLAWLILGLTLLSPLSAFAISSTVVISQAYGGGGNSGSVYKNDFIEIFNLGSTPIDLSGYSVQYAGATGTSWALTKLANLPATASNPSGFLQPGQYYLIAEAPGTGGTTALPAADATGTIAMAAGGFKVALVSNQTALTGACPTTGVVDFLGANSGGTSPCSEGTTAATPTNTQADIRKNSCIDTDNNSADFQLTPASPGTPNPRNSQVTPAPCSGTPPSGTGDASPNTLNVAATTLLTVAVTQGVPASAIASVTADLSAFSGGSATQPLFDDQTNGDATAHDGTYSFNFTIPAGTAGNTYTVNATITDAAARTKVVPITFTVTAPTAIVASGSAAPSVLGIGEQTLLTVTVTPGTNPASTNLVVLADLSAIGGSSTSSFHDDGANGDATAGDGVFSFQTTISGSPSGSVSLPVTVSDSQARSTSTAIALTITPVLSIMDIQGHGARSPYAGAGTALGNLLKTPDATHANIVTALKISGTSNGFFMQDSGAHTDLTASNAIFVFTGATVPTVSVGDSVIVSGKVQEFSGSTEIAGSPTVTVVSSGNTVPTAYDLSLNLPSTDPTQGICIGGASTINPATDGYQASNFACLDGMLVRMSNGVVVAPTSGSGGDGVHTDSVQFFYATAGNPRPFREPGLAPADVNITGAYSGPLFNGNPETIEIYYPGLKLTTSSLPDAGSGPGIYNAGQHIDLTGIIQGFQPTSSCAPNCALVYEMYPRTGADLILVGTPPVYPIPVATAAAGQLTIGSQNMLHFFNSTYDGATDTSQYTDTCGGTGNTTGSGGTGASDTCPTAAEYANRLSKMSLQIRTVLKAPIVQIAQEVENLNTLTDLANQIHADDATITYHPYLIAGNDPGGINIGVLVRAGVTVNSVSQLAAATLTDACSSGTSCLMDDRPPMLLDAVYQGYHFRVLAIYDRSLLNLGVNDYVGKKRRAQAEQIARIVQVLQTDGATLSGQDVCDAQFDATGTLNPTSCPVTITGSSTVPFVVLGDFNAYEFTDGYVDAVGTILGSVDTAAAHSIYPPTTVANTYNPVYVAPNPQLVNSYSPTLDPATHPDNWNDNYSYTFDGYAQEIDHILMSQKANQDFVQISHAHGNADVSSSSPDVLSASTARRTSDHDGQVVTLGYVVTPSAGANGTISASTLQTVSKNATPVFTVTPSAGYTATVGGTCGGNLNGMTYTTNAITTNCTVTASFALTTFTVTAAASGANGTITPPSQSVASGATATFTVTPATGYTASVSGDTCTVSNTSGTTWTSSAISSNCAVTATFAPISVLVTADAGSNGSITPTSQTVSYGATASFTVTPNSGYTPVVTGDTCTVTNTGGTTWTTSAITSVCQVNANFTINTYTVHASVAGANGTITPATQTVNSGSTASFTITPNSHYVASVSGDTCTVTSTGGNLWTSTPITANCNVSVSFSYLAGFVPLQPARVLDTRLGIGATVDGQFSRTGPVGQNGELDLTVLGRGGVPAGNVTAVVLNVTATDPTAAGFVTVWPTGSLLPNTSNLNILPGDTVPNLVIVKLGTGNQVSLFNGVGSTDLVADVVGYFGLNSDLTSLVPARLLDTRQGSSTTDGLYAGIGPVAANGQVDLPVAGRGGLPATGVGTVVLNVTATNPTAPGFLTVWPQGAAQPYASNLNFVAGLTIPNLVITQVGASGEVSLYNSAGSTDLIADVMGWFPPNSELTPVAPARLLETRAGLATVDGQFEGNGPLPSGGTLDLTVAGRGNIPTTGVSAVVLNVTVTNPTAPGFMTVWPTGSAQPLASNLNFTPGQTIANLVIAKIGSNGQIEFYNSAGSTDVVVDVVGWFSGP